MTQTRFPQTFKFSCRRLLLRQLAMMLLPLILAIQVTQLWALGEPALTAVVYKKIVAAQKQLQQNNSNAARAQLESVQDRGGNTAYDNAMIHHLLGYSWYTEGKLKPAAQAFERVYDYDIPLSLMQNNRRVLGQTYLNLHRYRDAITQLERWIDSAQQDQEPVQVLVAQAHYELKQYQSAAKQIQSAISSYQAKGKRPEESWLNLLQASLAANDDIKSRIATIKKLLVWYPKTEYWLALAGAYAQLEKMDNYLAILALAERKELLTTESQYVSLASVYFSEGAPQKAAAILEEGMAKKLVKRNIRNLRFLSSAYTIAREYERALVPLQQAAAQSKDGELDVMLGNALFQLARWDDASSAFSNGLKKGGLRQETTAWLLLGQSQLNLKQYQSAIEAFEQAALDEQHSKQAQQWLKYARYEQERQAKLNEGAES